MLALGLCAVVCTACGVPVPEPPHAVLQRGHHRRSGLRPGERRLARGEDPRPRRPGLPRAGPGVPGETQYLPSLPVGSARRSPTRASGPCGRRTCRWTSRRAIWICPPSRISRPSSRARRHRAARSWWPSTEWPGSPASPIPMSASTAAVWRGQDHAVPHPVRLRAQGAGDAFPGRATPLAQASDTRLLHGVSGCPLPALRRERGGRGDLRPVAPSGQCRGHGRRPARARPGRRGRQAPSDAVRRPEAAPGRRDVRGGREASPRIRRAHERKRPGRDAPRRPSAETARGPGSRGPRHHPRPGAHHVRLRSGPARRGRSHRQSGPSARRLRHRPGDDGNDSASASSLRLVTRQ